MHVGKGFKPTKGDRGCSRGERVFTPDAENLCTWAAIAPFEELQQDGTLVRYGALVRDGPLVLSGSFVRDSTRARFGMVHMVR